MKNDKVSLLKDQDVLIVPIQGELNDRELDEFQTRLLERVSTDGNIRGVVLDVSSLNSIDLFGARVLVRIVKMLALMDLRSVLVGLRPEVAITLTDIDLSFPGIATAVNLERGISKLKRNVKNDSKRR